MSARPRRVLVSTFGSAGDLFPLVPAVRRLREGGHDVRFAVPRALGLYLRTWRLPMVNLGTGAEMRVFEDRSIVTTRFGGWASWRRTAVAYVRPTLERDVSTLRGLFDGWRPDLVVTNSFAAAARVAARAHDVPHLATTIYPQHLGRLPRARGFARPLLDAVAALAPGATDDEVRALAWGTGGPAAVLHDRALLAGGAAAGQGDPAVLGFPYWDDGPARPGEADRVAAWIAGGSGPVVLVTLGSFLGGCHRPLWSAVAGATRALGVRAVVVGPRSAGSDAELAGRDDVLPAGFVPLSRVVDRVDAVVHHGGIGTTFGTLRAGRPAVVVPQAFDQPHNARLVAAAGAGLAVDDDSGLAPALARVLDDPGVGEAAGSLAAALVPSEAATDALVERVIEEAT